MIRKTHCETSPHRFCDVSLACHTIFEVDTFYYSDLIFTTTLKSVDLIEAWKAVLGEKIIRMWQWFTHYFLFDKELYEKWQTRLVFAELAQLLWSVLCYSFFSYIMLWVILLIFFANPKAYEYTVQLQNTEHQKTCSFLNPCLFFHFWEFIKSIIY